MEVILEFCKYIKLQRSPTTTWKGRGRIFSRTNVKHRQLTSAFSFPPMSKILFSKSTERAPRRDHETAHTGEQTGEGEVPPLLQRCKEYGAQRNVVGDPQDPEVIHSLELNSNRFRHPIGIKMWSK